MSTNEWTEEMECVLAAQSCAILCNPMDCSCQVPLSMGFSSQEYWSGLPLPSPRDLPNPDIEARSPALQADSLPSVLPGKPKRSCGKYRQIHRYRCTHTHTHTVEYYSGIKKWSCAMCNNMMDLDGIMLNEISEAEKDKYYILSLMCGT